MKTTQTSAPIINKHGRIRIALVIAGIVIAFLCMLTLMRDTRSGELSGDHVRHRMKSQRLVVPDFIGKAIAWL